jgi:hypothetical protein
MAGPEQDRAQEPKGGERPWDRPGAVRRDCEPHRGPLLFWLGGGSLLCGIASLWLVVPALIGLPLGVVVLLLGGRDLKKMAAGVMDPEGAELVKKSGGYAVGGVVLSLGAGAVYGGLLVWRLLFGP